MIRKMLLSELDEVGQIWLDGNLEAHDFIDEKYWLSNLALVKEQFKQAEIYLYDDGQIKGFAGMQGNYLAGIFVIKEYQSQGIGKKLLDFLKSNYQELSLDVYDKNEFAKRFYQHNGFKIKEVKFDSETDEKDLQLTWGKS